MEQEAKEAKNSYMREWRKNNKEKVKAAQKRYWEKLSKMKKEHYGQRG